MSSQNPPPKSVTSFMNDPLTDLQDLSSERVVEDLTDLVESIYNDQVLFPGKKIFIRTTLARETLFRRFYSNS